MSHPDILFNTIPIWVGVYALTAVFFGIATFILYKDAIRLILLGKKSNLLDNKLERFIGILNPVFGQSKVLQSFSIKTDVAGLAHFFIFWGFLSFALSYILFIFGDSIWHRFSETILTDKGIRIFVSYLDVLALIFLLVILLGVGRRWWKTPRRLSFDLTQKLDAAVILTFITLLMSLTILTEAFYVVGYGKGPHAEALIGKAIGKAFISSNMPQSTAIILHEIGWWLHLLIILSFSIVIALSKHTHLIGAPFNFFFRSLETPGTLTTPNLETAESFGAFNIKDFTWKQLLDGYACAVCGRCSDVCPANFSGKLLSPMHIVANLKDHMQEVGPSIIKGESIEGNNPLVPNNIPKEAIWDCLTCGACVAECPVGVEHVQTIVDIRRHLVMEKAEIPETGQAALVSLEQRGHPWRGTTYNRTDWMKDMNVRTVDENPNAEYLLWIGCTSALEKRGHTVARSLSRVLQRAKVDFAVLGQKETCTGDPARRLGNEYLYQNIASQTIETLKTHKVRKIITLCPHCFNVMKNEYPHLDGNFEVIHYSKFVDTLISTGKLKVIGEIKENVSYHDSCYLGRHNNIYEEPRNIATSIPGLNLLEMKKNRQQGFCCGAGGGHAWLEENQGTRINHMRTDQFLETGADTVAVSCPFCLQMFDEGLSSRDESKKRKAVDLIELVDQSTSATQEK
ncbi:MAG: Fe-S oxidoreductase [Chloroflexi bacterium]|nr:MAG: Fe-S oxidoreductase [Chloroflexota bacterium]